MIYIMYYVHQSIVDWKPRFTIKNLRKYIHVAGPHYMGGI